VTTPPSAARLAPLMLAVMASQALLVVLGPTIVAIADDLGASVSTVGQARSVTAIVAVVAALTVTAHLDRLGVARVIGLGALLALAACAAVAAAPTLAVFLLAHVLVGLALSCLLSAGFAGVGAFAPERRAWAVGYVAGANALAWIVVNPAVGVLAGLVSWRSAQAVPAAIALAALLASPRAASAGAPARSPVRTVLSVVSARRWASAELLAYGAWTALLTFVGAFYIERLGLHEAAAGWALAGGAAAYFLAATCSGRFAGRVSQRSLTAAAAVAMAALIPLQLSVEDSPATAVGLFCLVGTAAGLRTPASSGLGLAQLPSHPGAMMATRTAATQLGYLFGALVGGAVIASAGYAALGLVLAAGMIVSALLVLRVSVPAAV
jgi:predicted MFS family arabinose efflux permease